MPLLLFIQQQPAASHLQPLCLPRQVLGHKALSLQQVTHLCFGPLCASGLSLQELPKAMETLARLQARSHLSHLCGRYLSSRARSSHRAGDTTRAVHRNAAPGPGVETGRPWAAGLRPPLHQVPARPVGWGPGQRGAQPWGWGSRTVGFLLLRGLFLKLAILWFCVASQLNYMLGETNAFFCFF